MFSRKKNKEQKPQEHMESARPGIRKTGNSIPSIIAADLKVLGNIVSDGILDLDGIVEGNVKCHAITVRKNGHIKGDVIADNVQVYGRIQGLIKARNVHFFKGGRAEGVIMHESITIEDGAFVDGRFKRMERVTLDDNPADHIDIATLPAEEPKKLFGPGSASFDDDLKTPTFSSDDEAPIVSDAEGDKPLKARKRVKQESVMDNLRLISDAN